MPCHTRMKHLEWGFLWLMVTLEFGVMVTSLEPGFLDFDNLPDTNFSCVGKVIGGYYADLETSCQMFHVCTIGQLDEPMDIRFLCLNGTVFDQETRVCERIDEVDCSKSEQFYSLNLELYGNTQPSILEESPETEAPHSEVVKKSTTTTTTTTSRPTPPRSQRPNFIITTAAPRPQAHKPLQPPNNNFGGNQQRPTDIRFNPTDFKISLNPGAPPNIHQNEGLISEHNSKPISFQSFGDPKQRVIVTTHNTVYKHAPQPPSEIGHQKHQEYDEDDVSLEDSTEDSYSYGYHTSQQEPPKFNYRHEDYKPSTYRSVFHSATTNPLKISFTHRPQGQTTYRNVYNVGLLKPPQQQQYQQYQRGTGQMDKSVGLQHLQPMLPSLMPLTFSSPAPFSLLRHVETKRFIDNQQPPPPPQQQVQPSNQNQVHHKPPRIVISASASVSDASGRKFNYSLGTIGDSRFFGTAPQSYDDYKEEDVSLDPFYHDVPKLSTHRRLRRQVPESDKDYEAERDAIDVLRFLFNWYSSHGKGMDINAGPVPIPIRAETITEINEEFTPRATLQMPDDEPCDEVDVALTKKVDEDYVEARKEYHRPYLSLQLLKPPADAVSEVKYDEVFKNQSKEEDFLHDRTVPSTENIYYDYVDDNYEGVVYQDNGQGDFTTLQPPVATNPPIVPEVSTKAHLADGGRNYSVPEYVDDNYEPVVYQHKENDEQNQITAPQVLLLPPKVDGNSANSDIQIYSRPIADTTPNVDTTTNYEVPIFSQPVTTTKNTEILIDSRRSSQTQQLSIITTTTPISHIVTNSSSTSTTTSPVAQEVTTEGYHQILGILGFATKSPANQRNTSNRPKVNRGRARFSLDDIAVPSDVILKPESKSKRGKYTVTTESTPITSQQKGSTRRFGVFPDEKMQDLQDYSTAMTMQSVIVPVTTDAITTMKEYPVEEMTTLPVLDNPGVKEQQYEETSIPSTTISSTTAFVKAQIEQDTTTTRIEYELEDQEYNNTTRGTTQNTVTSVTVPTTQFSSNAPGTYDFTTQFQTDFETMTMEPTSEWSTTPEILTNTELPLTTTSEATTVLPLRNKTRRRSKSRFRLNETTFTTTTTSSSTTLPMDPSTLPPTTSPTTLATTTEPLETTTMLPTIAVQVQTHDQRFKQPQTGRTPTINEQIVDAIKHNMEENPRLLESGKKIEFNINAYTANLAYRLKTTPLTLLSARKKDGEVDTTSPTSKGAPYTNSSARSRLESLLPTTPISKSTAIIINQQDKHRKYTFNCFDKPVNQFYSDPRDCRLFHYCTRGFTRTQYLDMKFVCDLGTFFDDEKLVCSKSKPSRCA